MPAALFQPMQYLPSIESPLSDKLEALCTQVFDQIRSNQLHVPDVEYFDPTVGIHLADLTQEMMENIENPFAD
jgi:hypothetical protein